MLGLSCAKLSTALASYSLAIAYMQWSKSKGSNFKDSNLQLNQASSSSHSWVNKQWVASS